MLNLYSPESLEQTDHSKTDHTYLYIGGLVAISFLFGSQTVIGSTIGSAGFLYYTKLDHRKYVELAKRITKNIYDKVITKQPSEGKINELTSVFVDSTYSDEIV